MSEVQNPVSDALEKKYARLKQTLDRRLQSLLSQPEPETLYEPARYILSGNGKRIRPMLALLAAECVSGKSTNAINLALAVEVLHNFTLIHDDIMDNADLRHNRETVHKKWDANIAILTGDMMLAFAYRLVLKTPSKNLDAILGIFTESVITVCEGQAFDKEFELRSKVSIDDYLMMISKKTGRLIAASLELGGLAAGATPAQAKVLSRFGELIGQAFQVQDDLLDIMAADNAKFGKRMGGDVIEGKKTFLLLKGIELTKGKERALLQSVIDGKGIAASRVGEVKAIYEKCGVLAEAKKLIGQNAKAAEKLVMKLPNKNGRSALLGFTASVMQREF